MVEILFWEQQWMKRLVSVIMAARPLEEILAIMRYVGDKKSTLRDY